MKCRKCSAKAAIHLPQHRLALCKDHYLAWLPEQTERFIKKYQMFNRHERILIAVSGGKDSLSLWDVLFRLGYPVDGVYISLGIDQGLGYSAESRQYAAQFAVERGSNLRVFDVPRTYGETIPETAQRTHRGKDRPCSVCGVSKRHILNQVAREGGYDVLVTGHNLDDEAAVLLGNTLDWNVPQIARQSPLLPATPGLVRKAKPFCRFYERETAAYALLSGIEYVYTECPFAEGNKTLYYKTLLNQLEAERPGAKLQYYLTFLQARDTGFFQAPLSDLTLQPCPTCGQPTSSGGTCAFCRQMEIHK